MRTTIPAIPWRSAVKWLSVAATVGIYVVYVLGTVVTNTGSGQGCGGTWPLCKGKFIPDLALKTAIEWVHRVGTSIEGMLVLGLAVGAWAFWRNRREIKILVPLMLGILVVEAILGGIIAENPKSASVLAVHFGSSLVTVASVLLTSVVLFESAGADAVRDRPLPRRFAWSVGGLIALMYIVGYIGAYIGHRGIGLACPDWPLCQGAVVPSLGGAGGLARATDLIHRYAALVLVVTTIVLFFWTRRVRHARPDLYRGSEVAMVVIVLQALAGGYLVVSHLSLGSRLLHAGLVAVYFSALAYLTLHLFPRQRDVHAKIVRRSHADPGVIATTPSARS